MILPAIEYIWGTDKPSCFIIVLGVGVTTEIFIIIKNEKSLKYISSSYMF